jgi:hypothetical protein
MTRAAIRPSAIQWPRRTRCWCGSVEVGQAVQRSTGGRFVRYVCRNPGCFARWRCVRRTASCSPRTILRPRAEVCALPRGGQRHRRRRASPTCLYSRRVTWFGQVTVSACPSYAKSSNVKPALDRGPRRRLDRRLSTVRVDLVATSASGIEHQDQLELQELSLAL